MPRKIYITRREAAELSGTSVSTVKNAIDTEVVPAKSVASRSYVEIDDVPVIAMMSTLRSVALPIATKRRIRAWLRSTQRTTELALTPALYLRRPIEVEEAQRRATEYAALRARWIVADPAIRGGEPIVAGTRVSVYTLAARIAVGESEAVLADDFPHIPSEAREAAVLYAKANPRRGRPITVGGADQRAARPAA